jgi:hypothetical protein
MSHDYNYEKYSHVFDSPTVALPPLHAAFRARQRKFAIRRSLKEVELAASTAETVYLIRRRDQL